MIFCLGLMVVLLSETAIGKVCLENLNRPRVIKASSVDYEKQGFQNCSFLVSAPDDNTIIILNFTHIHGFENPDDTFSPTLSAKEKSGMPVDSGCLPRLRVMEVKANGAFAGDGKTLCLHPQVFRYSSRQVRVFFQWRHNHASGFKLVLQFQRQLSLCEHYQACGADGCVASSSSACSSPASQTGRNWTTLVIVIVIAVIVVALQTLAVLFCCQYRRVNQLWQERELQRCTLRAERAQLNPPTTPVTRGVMYSAAEAGQLDARVQHEVARQREHQIRLQSVHKDIHLNLPPFIPLSRDGEEGYTQSQRQLTSSHRYKGSTSICPPPNMTICPVLDSGPPFHSQSDMVLNKPRAGAGGGPSGGKAAHRTEPPMSAPPATTDNNNRKSNLNFNYPPASVGGSQPASRPTSHSHQHASLSLGMYGAGHTGWLAAGSPAGSTAANGGSTSQPTANGRRSPPGGGTGSDSLIGPPPPYTQLNGNNL